MNYRVETKAVTAQTLAAVRRHVLSRDIGRTWKPALDLVWEFLRRYDGLRAGGHNCFLYHHAAHPDAAMDIDFGVQVIRSFRDEGEVVCTQTPAGRAFGACSWEIYGDWTDDTSKLETQVVYLLR